MPSTATALDTGPKRLPRSFEWKNWLVPPVLFPLLLVGMIVVYAVVRTAE